MSGVYDVIVVGGGVEGSATAYNLAREGRKTLLVDKYPLPHLRGSSHGHSRIIRMSYNKDFYARMMPTAFEMWEQLAKAEDVKIFKPCGLLNVAAKDKRGQLDDTIKSLNAIQAPFDTLDHLAIAQKYPAFQLDARYQGVYDPSGGILLADKALAALWNQFGKNGGEIRDGEPVTSISPGQTVTVTTSRGQYRANSVVICAGPWTSKMVAPLGLHLPLKLCCHSGEHIDPDDRDSPKALDTEKVIRKEMVQFVKDNFPGLEPHPSIQEHCIYTNTPDSDFILDVHPHWKNIVVGAGFSGHGFKLAPVVGKILAELATGRQTSFDVSPFQIDRFFRAELSSKL